ncbi:MAG: hypothetical protein V3S17_02985 [candidate division Zixibacteria bacterium]
MKSSIISLIFLLSILLMSCNDKPTEKVSPIRGNWRWVQSCGGFAGTCIYADSVNYSRRLSFDYNSNFTEYLNDSLMFAGKYRIVRKLVWGTDTSDVIVIDDYPFELIIDYIRNDSLSVSEICFDCFVSIYVKLGPI